MRLMQCRQSALPRLGFTLSEIFSSDYYFCGR